MSLVTFFSLVACYRLGGCIPGMGPFIGPLPVTLATAVAAAAIPNPFFAAVAKSLLPLAIFKNVETSGVFSGEWVRGLQAAARPEQRQ